MLLAACYFAGEIILLIVLAFALMLVLQPVIRLLEKLYLPRALAAHAIIMVLDAGKGIAADVQTGKALDTDALDFAFWDATKQTAEELAAYLESYPDGHFAALARARLPQSTDENLADSAAGSPGESIELALWKGIRAPRTRACSRPISKNSPKSSLRSLHGHASKPSAVRSTETLEKPMHRGMKNDAE
jgi:hypothetical protein